MKRVIVIGLLVLAIVSASVSVVLLVNEGFGKLKPLEKGEHYRVLSAECVPRETAKDLLVTDHTFAVYYDASGLINVYNLNGMFLYGIQIETIGNGTAYIGFVNGCMNILSRGDRCYVFEGKQLVRTFTSAENKAAFESVKQITMASHNRTANGNVYYYMAASNEIKRGPSVSELTTVVSFPKRNEVAEELGMLALLAFLAITTIARGKSYSSRRV